MSLSITVVLTPATTAHATLHDYSANSKLTITGVRMETEVGYYMAYRSWCTTFVESGALDLHFGTAKDGGIGLQVDFSTIEDEAEQREKKHLFDVVTSAITVTSFDLVPHESNHPILMWFLRPVLRRIVRGQVEAALQEQVKSGLETLSRIAWEVKARAGEGIVGWLGGLYEVLVKGTYKDEPSEGDAVQADKDDAAAQDEEEALKIHVSNKGVSIDLEAGTVGVGAEGIVIPEGEAETPIPRPSVVEVVKGEVEGTVRQGRETGEAVLAGLGELGEAVQEFPEEVEREEELVEAGGWRSSAFDFAV